MLLENTFFVLMITIPLFFIILGISNIKKFKKNGKFRKNIVTMVILSFTICGTIWGILKMTNRQDILDKHESGSENSEKIESDNNKSDNNKIDNSNIPDNKVSTGDDPKNEPNATSKPNTSNNTSNINGVNNADKPVNNSSDGVNKTSKGFDIEVRDGVTYIDGFLVVNKTYPLPDNYIPTNTHKAVTASSTICQECIDEEAYGAYTRMKSDASSQGLSLWIASGYRSYSYQNGLYNSYVKRSGKTAADTYSARAGHSEHQSGLAFDLNSVSDSFATTKEGIWVNDNCYKYGFIIRYPKGKDNETGYKYESWHLRYVGVDLASKLYNAGDWITLETYFGITSQYQE